jgi:hypothetical protein
MKKILLFSIVSLFVSNAEAQMYVSPNSYVYVNDQFVYVTQDVNLDNTGNFYLRNQSQLLQGVAGLGANSGLGNLSVYQEGTTNNFQYNYWCSPVGLPDGTIGNSNFGITRLFRPSVADKVTSTPATIITGLNGVSTDTSLSISNRWIWKYVATNMYGPGIGGWVFVGSTATVDPGLGFTMKGTSGSDTLVSDVVEGVANNPGSAQRYDFRGKPNDGDMSATASNVNMGGNYINLTLVGNPYPSAINLNLYLLENSGYAVDYGTGAISNAGVADLDNTAYFWEHDKSNNTHNVGGYVGGYGTYVPDMSNAFANGVYVSAPMNTYSGDGETGTGGPSSGNVFERMFTPVGQGFMIHGARAFGTATMRNRYRVFVKEGAVNFSEFERNANTNRDNEYWDAIPNVAGVDYTQFKKKSTTPKFFLHTKVNDAVIYENALVFGGIASENYDNFDGLCAYANASKVAYLTTKDGAEKLVISSQPFDINARIPLAFVTDEQASFNVKVSDYSQFDLADNIYLFDKESGIYYDIKNGEYNANLAAGNYANRFEITFKNVMKSLGNENALVADAFQVYQNNSGGMLTIQNTMNKEVTSLNLYDVTGKLVISKANLGKGNTIEVSTAGLSDGVYIVKLNTRDNFAIDKKVSIFR